MSRSTSGNMKELTREGRVQSAGGKDRDRDGRDGRDGRGRGSQQTSNLPPVAPLKVSDTRWQPGQGSNSEMDVIKKKVLSLLNKVSLYPSIIAQRSLDSRALNQN